MRWAHDDFAAADDARDRVAAWRVEDPAASLLDGAGSAAVGGGLIVGGPFYRPVAFAPGRRAWAVVMFARDRMSYSGMSEPSVTESSPPCWVSLLCIRTLNVSELGVLCLMPFSKSFEAFLCM